MPTTSRSGLANWSRVCLLLTAVKRTQELIFSHFSLAPGKPGVACVPAGCTYSSLPCLSRSHSVILTGRYQARPPEVPTTAAPEGGAALREEYGATSPFALKLLGRGCIGSSPEFTRFFLADKPISVPTTLLGSLSLMTLLSCDLYRPGLRSAPSSLV